ncbi:hypothetical protein KM043_004228 [Ampulex compressa]|nr:hypothetical protein KM043_004228 [Ampulex compressa]
MDGRTLTKGAADGGGGDKVENGWELRIIEILTKADIIVVGIKSNQGVEVVEPVEKLGESLTVTREEEREMFVGIESKDNDAMGYARTVHVHWGNDATRTINKSGGAKVKIGASYGWESPVVRKRSAGRKNSGALLKYLKLYCEYSSLTSFKYLVENQATWVERLLWIVVYTLTLSTMVFMVHNAYQEFLDAPIVTTVDADYFPTNKLEFPGVSICTINRISREQAMDMATEMTKVTNLDVEEILYLILQLGDLYQSAYILPDNRHTEIDRLLRKFYNGSYDITSIMKRLTPRCADVLMVCIFHGYKRNCSDIFAFRKTQDGFCCTFNYAREEDDIPVETGKVKPIEVQHVKDLGIGRGLTVVMDPLLEDYFYTIFPINGWKVTIFNPRDYPDMTSGGVSEVYLTPLTERYLEMDALSFYSTRDIMSYPVKKRGCIFPDELLTMYAGYTYSDCIVDCKLEDIWRTCSCRPFYHTRRGKNEYSKRVCNIADIPCLHDHKRKWFSVIPHEDRGLSNIVNETWSTSCKNCYPSCEDVRYIVRSSVSYMDPGVYRTTLLNNLTIENQSVLHVYFQKVGTIRLKQDVIYRWYELMSNIGGICGVFIGVSLISFVELAYYAVLLFLELWCEPRRGEEEIRRQKSPVRTIYWGELLPRPRTAWERPESRNRDRIGY